MLMKIENVADCYVALYWGLLNQSMMIGCQNYELDKFDYRS